MRTYRKARDYQKDAAKLGQQGWTVVSSMEHRPSIGIRRAIALGGLGALVFRPKPEIVVTYRRMN